ncbi:glycogen debranching protein [Pyrococcus furiosus DSM 3638]|uniref:Glycogen debranching protein n=3 Tax=Pyrococcus furiosus TaxID=2261 RepID=A0A5C0XQS1_PYRFU|nr:MULTISPECIES: amylo-alpha-1,6-glucosidase [Pyrococcus]AAL81584.1 hypothetical protein PF1460 [Pyrococcus furiosus DSM 3638]AFN04243.1 hypothetical protein PFC_06535 [Pyrococcus furiosus COM1]MDK2869493.1 hypothetical protein [Pyrococcus sp.]QEK79089.1 glycogen debranching protein [Pyrococcus furiosus DSM 3638]
MGIIFGGSSFGIVEGDSIRLFMYDTEFCEVYTQVKGDVVFRRIRKLKGNKYLEKIIVANPNKHPVDFEVIVNVTSKFRDVFEVRRIATPVNREISRNKFGFEYRGRDGVVRKVIVLTEGLSGSLPPYSWRTAKVKITLQASVPVIHDPSFPQIRASGLYGLLKKALEHLRALSVEITGNKTLFAGIPDFFCVFGRDSIISSLFLLPYDPKYAKGTLFVLAKLQGEKFDPKRLEEPGKIPHEYRLGELSLSGNYPFSPYYGSIDATPLYLILAGEYYRWTKDQETIKKLRENLFSAYEWLIKKLEEGNGFLVYTYANPYVPMNQGWKDSREGVPDEDGLPTKPPVALVEVQGYAYKALLSLAEISEIINPDENYLIQLSRELKKKFNREFKGKKGYKLALNSDVLASNQGHLLFSGIVEDQEKVIEALFSSELLTRWGIRTLSEKEKAYNPFSYHNGSIWPHDNAIIALGLSKVGELEKAEDVALRVLRAFLRLNSLPELYAGVDAPEPFIIPRANEPQAWSASSIFAFITASLGITPKGVSRENTKLPNLSIYPVIINGKKHKLAIKNGEIKISRIS